MSSPDPSGASSSTATSTVVLNADVNPYTQQMQAAERQTNAAASAVDKLSSSLGNLTKSAGHKLINIGRDDILSLGAATASAALFEKQLSTLRATSAVTGQSMGALTDSITSTTSKFPVSRGQVIALDEALTSLGVKGVQNINSLAQTFIKLGAATGESTTGLATGLTQLSRQMGNTSSQQIGNFANSLLTVSKNSGVSATSVLNFSQAIAPMARQAGIGEAAVLGISAAFSKAGADGYVAANTFNSIVNDITTLTRTGSPELAKYASFIGLTVSQFKKLPAKEQITDIFNAIGKGGPQALNFVNELGLGTRSLTAVQALAQSGGLNAAISQATGASTNQRNLNKGSSAAFTDLTDAGAKLRNAFTQFAELIGGPLLTPLRWLTEGFTKFLDIVNAVVSKMGPIPAILGVIAGAASPLLGVGLVHAGAIGTAALARTVLTRTSGPRTAYREARVAGSRMAGGATAEEAVTGLNPVTATYYNGDRRTIPMRARYGYAAGDWVGRRSGPGAAAEAGERVVPVGGFRAGYRRGRTGQPIPTATVVTEAEQAAAAETSAGRSAFSMGARSVVTVPTMLLNSQSRGLRDSYTPGLSRSAYTSAASTEGYAKQLAAFKADTDARVAESGVIRVVVGDLTKLGSALATFTVETTKAGGSMLASPLHMGASAGRTLPGAAGVVGPAEAGAGGVARAAGTAVGGLARAGSFLMNPMTLMAAMFAVPAIGGIAAAMKQPGSARVNDDEGAYLNPVQKLNSQLGITTTKLADFASGLGGAASKLPNAPSNTLSMTDASHVTKADSARYAGRGSTKDHTLNVLTGNYDYDVAAGYGAYSGQGAPNIKTKSVRDRINSPQVASALLSTYDLSDPRTVAATKDNLLSLGYSKSQVESVLAQAKTGKTDFGTLGQAATKIDVGAGARATLSSAPVTQSPRASRRVMDAALTAIDNQSTAESAQHSARYTSARQLQNVAALLSPEMRGAVGRQGSQSTNPRVAAIARALATVSGGKAADFYSNDAGVYQLKTGQGGLQGVAELLSKSGGGRALLGQAGVKPGSSITATQLQAIVTGSASQASSAIPSTLTSSAIGRAIGGSQSFQSAAFGTGSGNPAAEQKAIEDAANQAIKLSRNSGAASEGLMKLADATGGAAGTLLTAAAQWARTLQGYQMPYMSRGQQSQQLLQNMRGSYAASHGPGVHSQASVDQYKSDRDAWEQNKQANFQYLQSMYTQAQSFHTQMVRGQQDENEQIFRSNRDFQIQMLQSQQDYQRQTQRSQQDYRIQMQRSAQQSAETIYNPFTRVQPQDTSDVGSVSQNLQYENQQIKQQFADLKELKKLGVSQATIDTLQLADPSNAQQTHAFTQTIEQNRAMVAQVNGEVTQRQADTKQLTQSDFSESYRNTVSDFTRGLSRASQDYSTARDRAVAGQKRGLGDMATDYNKMVRHSGQDLATAMTELYGSYADMFGKTMGKVPGWVAKYAPQAAAIMQKELDAIKPPAWMVTDPTTKPPAAGDTFDSQRHQAELYHAPQSAGEKQLSGGMLVGAHAAGGISTYAHVAHISENNKPEAIIPLDARGQGFMTGMYTAISRSLVQQLNVAGHPSAPRGQATSIIEDHSTTFSGDIHLEGVQDTTAMIRQLQARQRMARLARPAAVKS